MNSASIYATGENLSPTLYGQWGGGGKWIGTSIGEKWENEGHLYEWWYADNADGGYWYWLGYAPIGDGQACLMILCGLYVGFVTIRRRKTSAK